MNHEFDSASDLQHRVKMLKGQLKPVRDYVDPYAEFDKGGQGHTDYMERWKEQEPYLLP